VRAFQRAVRENADAVVYLRGRADLETACEDGRIGLGPRSSASGWTPRRLRAPVLLRDQHAHEAEVGEAPHHVVGKLARLEQLRCARLDDLGRERAGRLPDEALLLGHVEFRDHAAPSSQAGAARSLDPRRRRAGPAR
jgi:hypothetical protein